jgi:glycosidase
MNSKIIIYQLLPRLFGNTQTSVTPHGDIETNGCGKFQDITELALNKIKELGITHVWFTGIIEHATQTNYAPYGIAKDHSAVVKGKAGSPYAIKDYYDVDPDLAVDVTHRMEEFEALIVRTHQQGLKALIDFVPNHVARQYHSDAKPVETSDLGEHDNQQQAFDPQNNFYYLPNKQFAGQFDLIGNEETPYVEFPAKATGNDQFTAQPTINDWYETIKLNYGIDYVNGHTQHFDPIPDTWHKMRDILLFWANKGIDGFRCDMAEMVPVEFWGWVIPQVKTAFPDVLFIAEIYNPAAYRHFLEIGKFDLLYDKVGMYDTLRAIITDYESARAISVAWQKESDILPRMLFFLENHDEQRVASSFFANNAEQAMPGMIVAATISTSPIMIYFGQELGEKAEDAEGFSGNDGRTTIFDYWRLDTIQRWYNKGACDGAFLTNEEQQLRAFYQRLLTLSLQETAISEGEMFDLMYVNYDNPHFNVDKQFAFLRKSTNSLLLICVNFDAICEDIEVNIPQHAFTYLQLPDDKEVLPIDLLTEEDEPTQLLSSHQPFRMHLKANSGKILKLREEL